MEKYDETQMDAALDKLLKRATDPRFLKALRRASCWPFSRRSSSRMLCSFQPRPRIQRWAVGLPLAASLALGIYLGARGTLDNYMPDSITERVGRYYRIQNPPAGLMMLKAMQKVK